MRIWHVGLAAATLMAVTSAALAHHSRSCRPYTIEKVCWEEGRPCHLHMVYADGHNPAGPVPDGYWYSSKPRKSAHRSHKAWKSKVNNRHGTYATCREFKCWFKHKPEHRY